MNGTQMIISVTIASSGLISLLDWNGMGRAEFVGLKNYAELLHDRVFRNAIGNSLVFLACTLVLQLPVAVFLAILIVDCGKREKIYRTIYFIPVIIMTSVTGQLWMKLYDPINGLINQFLGAVGLEALQHNWLFDRGTVMIAATIPSVWQWMGYHMLIVYSAIKSLPEEMYESARIDGANRFRIAWNIILPNIMPMLKVSVTFMVVGSMKAFDLIYILTEGGPVHASEVPTITMYKTIFSKYYYGMGSAMAMLVTLLFASMAAYACTRMRFRYGETLIMVFLAGIMIPVHASLLPLFMLFKNIGILNTRLSLIIPYTAFALPVALFILTGFLKTLPMELEEAACMDGCNIYQIFYRIVLPLLKIPLSTIAVFTFINSWNELMFSLTFTTDAGKKTLPVAVMSFQGIYMTDWGPIGAAMLVATAPTFFIYLFLSEQMQKGMLAGAVKG